jgi:cytochrome c
MHIFRSVLVYGLVFMASTASAQDNAQVAHGKALVENNCARCHAIGQTDKSTHPNAPEFRTLSRLYPIESLEETLAIWTGRCS